MEKFLVATIVLLVAFPVVPRAQQTGPTRSSPGATTDLAQGKAIFVGRCAKCHDEDANKKLADGTTLLARLAASKNPQARLATRLKNVQESRQVMAYMQSLLERQRSSQAPKQTARFN